MATKKKLLQAAAGTAAASGGAGGLNVEQVFSTYLYDGNGNENVIDNGINLGQSNDGGSGIIDPEVGNTVGVTLDGSNSGLDFGTGDFTFELFVYHTENSGVANNSNWDIYYAQNPSAGNFWFGRDASTNVVKCRAANMLTGTTSIPLKQWSHIAVVMYNGVIKSYLNGVEQTSETVTYAMDVATNTNPYIGNYYSGSYGTNGRISNFRIVKGTALYTSNNFTVPTSPLTDISGTVFLGFQDEGPFVDNSSNSITVTDQGGVTASTFGPFDAADAGEGGLVWHKQRTSTASHNIQDTERGTGVMLTTNGTGGENTHTERVTSFNSNGFSVGNQSRVNAASNDYVSWTFRNAPKFFSCVTYTGDGTSNRSISHDLDHNIGTVIVKRTDGTSNWMVWHRSLPDNEFLRLNVTDAQGGYGSFYEAGMTTTTFGVNGTGTYGNNVSGATYVAYLFAHNDGDGDFGPTGDQDIIKCGSYTEPASGSQTINLGFEPQFILIKSASVVGQWQLLDTMRGLTDNQFTRLEPNSSGAESTLTSGYVYPLSTGFNAPSGFYGSGAEIIYIAIRRGPMAVPTDATDVFAIDGNPYATQDVPTAVSSFDTVDFALLKKDTAVGDWFAADRLRQGQTLYTNKTDAEAANIYNQFDYMYGWNNYVTTPISYISYMWKRAPNYFDVVAYTGNGVRGHTINHNLGVAPEMIWVKNRDQPDFWVVYHSALGNDTKLILNDTSATSASDFGWWAKTDPTDQVFSVGESGRVNGSGENLIAYLFASLDGVSKVGSFTMAGSDINVDCGFSSSARFVLLKRTDSTSNWLVFDSERGIVAGADSLLLLNTTDAENPFGALDLIDPYSSGFTAVSANIANGDWIFYAIA